MSNVYSIEGFDRRWRRVGRDPSLKASLLRALLLRYPSQRVILIWSERNFFPLPPLLPFLLSRSNPTFPHSRSSTPAALGDPRHRNGKLTNLKYEESSSTGRRTFVRLNAFREWMESNSIVRRLREKEKKRKTLRPKHWWKREWKTRREGLFFKPRNRRLHQPRGASCIRMACVFSKYREIWSKWRCYSGGHSRAIVIYESGRLDQLIGPIEIIFLLPGGRGEVWRAHASIRNCRGRTQKRRSDWKLGGDWAPISRNNLHVDRGERGEDCLIFPCRNTVGRIINEFIMRMDTRTPRTIRLKCFHRMYLMPCFQ